MLFNSHTFLLFFLAILILHRLPLRWTLKKVNLLIASYLFYAAWNPPFVVLIWISTAVDWFAAKRMGRTDNSFERLGLLLLSLTANLGLLGFFKYGNFLLDNFVASMHALGIPYQPPSLSIILPVGISFYTFQTLSYTIDVYRGKLQPWGSFLDFALFVTFFPQLVAGPIVRAAYFLPQCIEARQATREQLGWGFFLLTMGLFEKVVLADRIMAPVADFVYNAPSRAGFADAWIGTLAFSSQIFFDFAGYSTCAIGVGLCLGFVLPDNFRFPYGAVGFSDFWQRWHISLSTWLRDYLYIPLGGNRKGATRTYINLMLTMLLGGLWHGASWRFVLWGGLHGLYLIIERLIQQLWGETTWARKSQVRFLLALLTYSVVCVTWVFFRAEDFSTALTLVTTMFGGGPDQLSVGMFDAGMVMTFTVGLLISHWLMRNVDLEHSWKLLPWPVRSVVLAFLLTSLALSSGDARAFIYFQF